MRKLFLLALALVVFATACQGPPGLAGSPGSQGQQGEAPNEAQLLALIEQVVAKHAEDLRGPQGLQGPQGKLGPQGLKGIEGLSGETPDISKIKSDIDSLGLSLRFTKLADWDRTNDISKTRQEVEDLKKEFEDLKYALYGIKGVPLMYPDSNFIGKIKDALWGLSPVKETIYDAKGDWTVIVKGYVSRFPGSSYDVIGTMNDDIGKMKKDLKDLKDLEERLKIIRQPYSSKEFINLQELWNWALSKGLVPCTGYSCPR